MPESHLVGDENWHQHFTVRCLLGCGIVAQTPEPDVPQRVAVHFQLVHPDVQQPLRQNREWESFASPLRCDTCNEVVELPYWRHVSTPPTRSSFTFDADGLWLLCETCHDLRTRGDLAGWVQRHEAIAVEQSPILLTLPQVRATMRNERAAVMRQLLERLNDGEWISLPEPG